LQSLINRFQDGPAEYTAALGMESINEALQSASQALDEGRLEEAEACCRRETQNSPTDADARYNLGLTLQARGEFEAALEAYGQALELRPDYVDALVNRGVVCRELLRMAPALDCFDAAIRLAPDNAEAHWERGTTLVSLGELEQGWKDYEWRWKLKDFSTPAPAFGCPQWDGSPLNGKRIFLHAEQGYGDVIQTIRYAPMIARLGGEVIVGCPQPLRPLLESVEGVSRVVTNRSSLLPLDAHAPLMSLPAIFRTGLHTIPSTVPYLQPPPSGLRIGPATAAGLRVGIAWAGDRSHRNDHNRSMSLSQLEPLTQMPGIKFFSLQVGQQTSELSRHGFSRTVTDLGSRFRDFGDTAGAIADLDLVITVDTAVAHLAGALARPVWVLLPYNAEWRWMLGRLDSPWYPTMRLFRQPSRGDWVDLIAQVSKELARLTPHGV